MATNAPSTARVKRFRERRSRGVAMLAPVEVGEGGIDLLVRNGLLEQQQTGDRKAVAAACLAALEQWSEGRGARTVGIGFRRRDKVPSRLLISATGAHTEAAALLRRRGQGGGSGGWCRTLRSRLRGRCRRRGVSCCFSLTTRRLLDLNLP